MRTRTVKIYNFCYLPTVQQQNNATRDYSIRREEEAPKNDTTPPNHVENPRPGPSMCPDEDILRAASILVDMSREYNEW